MCRNFSLPGCCRRAADARLPPNWQSSCFDLRWNCLRRPEIFIDNPGKAIRITANKNKERKKLLLKLRMEKATHKTTKANKNFLATRSVLLLHVEWISEKPEKTCSFVSWWPGRGLFSFTFMLPIVVALVAINKLDEIEFPTERCSTIFCNVKISFEPIADGSSDVKSKSCLLHMGEIFRSWWNNGYGRHKRVRGELCVVKIGK